MTSENTFRITIQPPGEIDSVAHFVSEIFRMRTPAQDHKFWYRGVSQPSYQLVPSVGREQPYAGRRVTLTADQERSLLHRFRRRAYPHLQRAMTAGEAIFLARHHGLPTRLLDWTANALFALYFASVADQEHDGKLWAMLPRSDTADLDAFLLAGLKGEQDLFTYRLRRNESGSETGEILDSDSVKIVHPFFNSPRLLAQDGAFTIHSNPWRSLESYANDGTEFAHPDLDIDALYSWLVPTGNKVRLIKELSGLGITHRLLFPDLDGVAKSLWETEVLWSREDC